MRIEGSGALVAGGASGLGAATARRLHAAGATVVICDLNAEKGEALAAGLGERARFAAANVTDADAVQAAVESAAEADGGLRISVCCAGIGWAQRTASKNGPHDLASRGIRVVTIAPGTFDTPLLGALPEAARTELGRQIPFPSRLGEPDEFAALACHVVTNPMLNGETIRLDGALRMPPR